MIRFRPSLGRPLTQGEQALAAGLFGTALDPGEIRLHRARWWPFQPRNVVMAPDGHIWFHPGGMLWRDDFSRASERLQALFVHELTHVWQHQRGLCLLLRRHPFCRYAYRIVPGRPLEHYGIEQQASLIEHAFLARAAGSPIPQLEDVLYRAGFA